MRADFEKFQNNYNINITPEPEVFQKIQKFFKEKNFDEISNNKNEEENKEIIEEMDNLYNELNDFIHNIETFEIKLKIFIR